MSATPERARRSGLRTASWGLGAASVALPAALFAYQSHQFRVWAEQHPGGVCGMGMFAAIALSALLGIGLSALALLLGWLDHRAWRRPLSLRRAIELLLVGLRGGLDRLRGGARRQRLGLSFTSNAAHRFAARRSIRRARSGSFTSIFAHTHRAHVG